MFQHSNIASLLQHVRRPHTMLTKHNIRPTTRNTGRITQINRTRRVNSFRRNRTQLHRMLLNRFTSNIVRRNLRAHTLFLRPTLRNTLQWVRNLHSNVTLQLTLERRATRRLPHLINRPALKGPHRMFANGTIVRRHRHLINHERQYFRINTFRSRHVMKHIRRRQHVGNLFMQFRVN